MREFFGGLYGNERTKKRLGNAILEGKLPHAFIISGAKGAGKKTLALQVSAALNCENLQNNNYSLPCNKCNTCRRIFGGNFTDIKFIRRREDKQSIGVEDIRDARDDMYLSATESDTKIYIIEEAEKITPEAQNALLKVIEEPPTSMVVFFLAKETDRLLTTVKSRSQSIGMEVFEPEKIGEYIKSVSERAANLARINRADFESILMSADGRIGRALLLLDSDASGIKEERETVDAILSALRQGASYKELYSALSRLPKSRAEFSEMLEEIMKALRDMTVLKYSTEEGLLYFKSAEDALSMSEGIGTKRLVMIYGIFKDALIDNSKNVSVSTVTCDLGAKIKSI